MLILQYPPSAQLDQQDLEAHPCPAENSVIMVSLQPWVRISTCFRIIKVNANGSKSHI